MTRVGREIAFLRRMVVERGWHYDEMFDYCMMMERRYVGDATEYAFVRACEVVLEEMRRGH